MLTAQAAAELRCRPLRIKHLTALLAVLWQWLELPRFPVTLTGDTAGFSLAFGGAVVADREWFWFAFLKWAAGLSFGVCNKLAPAMAAGACVKPAMGWAPGKSPPVINDVTG